MAGELDPDFIISEETVTAFCMAELFPTKENIQHAIKLLSKEVLGKLILKALEKEILLGEFKQGGAYTR